MTHVITAVIIAGWICAIALVAIQNADPVSLRFLSFESVQIPVGLLLSVGVAIGVVGMAVLLPLWTPPRRSRRRPREFEELE